MVVADGSFVVKHCKGRHDDMFMAFDKSIEKW